MPNFKQMITDLKGKEQKEEVPQDKYVIYKENNKFRGTPRSNYDAETRDVNKIQDFDDFKTHEQVRDYLIQYGKGKSALDFDFEDYDNETSIPDQIDQLTEAMKNAKTDEEWEGYHQRRNRLLQEWNQKYGE